MAGAHRTNDEKPCPALLDAWCDGEELHYDPFPVSTGAIYTIESEVNIDGNTFYGYNEANFTGGETNQTQKT